MIARWEDMTGAQQLAAKLADAGPSEEEATAWVEQVMTAEFAARLARLRRQVRALHGQAPSSYWDDALDAVEDLLTEGES